MSGASPVDEVPDEGRPEACEDVFAAVASRILGIRIDREAS